MDRPSYALRPAKHIQRRMTIDALRRLRAFSPLGDYEYVGFGGLEFVDFELVHRELGISRMVSIEKDFKRADRYRFNVPFSGIRLDFDRASGVLPTLLDEPKLRIVWLDYECRLNLEVLQDVNTALRKLLAGSVLLVSVNAQGPRLKEERLDALAKDVEPDRVPPATTDASLAKWGWAQTSHRILSAEAAAEIARRSDGAAMEQLFHFRYADGARMLTWGGILVAPANRPTYEGLFDHLPQVRRADEEPYEIAPPVLTIREALALNAQLPETPPDDLEAHGMSTAELHSYANLYRWYPPVPAAM
ncbi:MAG: hypothetical protein M3P18_05110 [Actinomycetota bacterium]|nr:hypothetical protein [Actinomycetota bacterium]